ncbi:hypothetical protein BCR43DRAFT_515791 [Syncephalastrum racemosum]|uniref:RmlD-like substrate binding domain-containing protein n=1 Tax=Syncephalastrum racemosum TaxID=13706 RepID=A0A1X2HAI3_SYNRA|nr:hypothetical protein BCR43DRAFT_515791 [Syncephalastrum racemosum]
MKVIVTGASGLLGRAVTHAMVEAGHQVVGTAFSRADKHAKLVKLDLTDASTVQRFIEEEKPDVLVHCAAERRPDVAENDHEATLKLNASVPSHLAELAKQHGMLLIYISTDYVFDGTNPPYEVSDTPHPLNFYGESKLRGEEAVLAYPEQSLVLRVPILYGPTEYDGESAVNVLLGAVKNQGKSVQMDDFAQRYPTHVQDVARVLKDLAELGKKDGRVRGIFHFSGHEVFTKYTMCGILGKIMNMPIDHLTPQRDVPASAAASRPKDAHLSNRRLIDNEIDITSVPFEQWWISYLTPQLAEN